MSRLFDCIVAKDRCLKLELFIKRLVIEKGDNYHQVKIKRDKDDTCRVRIGDTYLVNEKVEKLTGITLAQFERELSVLPSKSLQVLRDEIDAAKRNRNLR